eukprot:1917352-Pyramimonas_sp.AAC.1
MRSEKRRRGGPPSSPTSPEEVRGYRTMVAQIQWLARETRPDVAGGASLHSAALPTATLEDA